MTREKCYDLAEQLGLDIVSVTESSNGYPQNVQLAMTGFKNFEQAEEVAKANDLTTVCLYKRDGWDLWTNRGYAHGALTISEEDYGDDYISYNSSADDDDLADDLRGAIDGVDELDAIFSITDFYKKIKEEIEILDDNELVLARMYDADTIEVMKKELMSWHDGANSTTIAIAVI